MSQPAGPEIDRLIQLLAKLPGLGPRSARRAALQLIKDRRRLMVPLADALRATSERVVTCTRCGNVDTSDPCHICRDERRNGTIICLVEDIADLWALERARAFKGRYHVLGGVLSALDGIGPEDLSIGALLERARDPEVIEVIVATSATVDGQTTAHYLTDILSDCQVVVSRLAHGVPVGGELDYLDDGTLNAALNSRRPL